ncbi:hypothetical protein BDK51DRAFT_36841 [Blyttiomyces helicus]|uniref:Uncharacterized protein n=1 Tax=Blyttiomyces helicus TaxID=388810 RepID=A0A4P9WI53_9FUNG|nr:hypothetical protein BDK51DRAFT_36841 [Blyttiomyces helicus]|eukprot:RKO92531.1 hypothetical protein BDK51DRAFT_36841 [Blyttiomyces helicus]
MPLHPPHYDGREPHKDQSRSQAEPPVLVGFVCGCVLLSWKSQPIAARPGSHAARFGLSVVGYWLPIFFNCALFKAEWDPEEVDIDGDTGATAATIEEGARNVAPPEGRWACFHKTQLYRPSMRKKSVKLMPFHLSELSSVTSTMGVESDKHMEASPWERPTVVHPRPQYAARPPATAAAAVTATAASTDLLETFGTHALLNRFRLASKMAAALAACSWYAMFCSTEVLESVAAIGSPEANEVFSPPGSNPEKASWNEVTLR